MSLIKFIYFCIEKIVQTTDNEVAQTIFDFTESFLT